MFARVVRVEMRIIAFPPQLLCLVGEAFGDCSDQVCGAVVNIRTKGDKIAVWTSDYESRDAVTHIG